VLDGELVVLGDAGRPLFIECLFGHRRPTYVAFDLLAASGVDLPPLLLRDRKARLAKIGKQADGWMRSPHAELAWRRSIGRMAR